MLTQDQIRIIADNFIYWNEVSRLQRQIAENEAILEARRKKNQDRLDAFVGFLLLLAGIAAAVFVARKAGTPSEDDVNLFERKADALDRIGFNNQVFGNPDDSRSRPVIIRM